MKPENSPIRKCVVTGESYPKGQLLRFVISPEDVLVFDVKSKLPGRGVYVMAQKDILEKAITKRAFSRGLKQAVTIPDNLVTKVEDALYERMIALIMRAKQSRMMINGYEKVSASLKNAEARILLHAADAAEDGMRKLNNIANANEEFPIFIMQLRDREQLSASLHLPNPVHLAILSKDISKAFVKTAQVWAGFMQKDRL